MTAMSAQAPVTALLTVDPVCGMTVDPDTTMLKAEQGGHPLLVTGRYGKGRTLAWTSDISPHWLPAGFYEWPGYTILWRNIVGWLSKN